MKTPPLLSHTRPRRPRASEHTLSRRTWLLTAALASLSESAAGLSRPPAGGTLLLSLPVSTGAIDPHDPFDLTAALLGSALFEPLYQRLPSGLVYPTLAAELPKERRGKLQLELRPGLRSGEGAPLDGPTIAASLRRSQRTDELLGEPDDSLARLGEISGRGTVVEFSGPCQPQEAARLLARPTSAIVPPGFAPTRPSGTGALFSQSGGITRLARNPWAPRGGSFVDAVTITSRDLRSCLRDFEMGTSHVGLLGQGLYQRGRNAKQLTLGRVGTLLLLPGERLAHFAAPGVLTEELSRTSRAGLESLGVRVAFPRGPTAFRGPPLRIDVDASQPWLVAIAEELARVWNRPSAAVRAHAEAPARLRKQRLSSDFHAELVFLRTGDPVALHTALYRLDGTPAPRRVGTAPAKALEWTVRRLRLGFVGFLEAHGALSLGLRGLGSKGDFALENAFFAPGID